MLLLRNFFFTKSLKIPKGFIRSCKLEKDRHHNDQRKNDKKKHIVVENTMHRELKIEQYEFHYLIPAVNSMWPRRVNNWNMSHQLIWDFTTEALLIKFWNPFLCNSKPGEPHYIYPYLSLEIDISVETIISLLFMKYFFPCCHAFLTLYLEFKNHNIYYNTM